MGVSVERIGRRHQEVWRDEVNVLFVGGVADGRRETIEDGRTTWECVSYSHAALALSNEDMIHQVYHLERYNLFPLFYDTRAVVFAHESLTPTEVLELLLDGYIPRKR
jgi:hypothetical protein